MSFDDGLPARVISMPASRAGSGSGSLGDVFIPKRVAPFECAGTKSKWKDWMLQARILCPANIDPDWRVLIKEQVAEWSKIVFPEGLQEDVQQLFMPRRDEREFFEHIIHFGSQDSLNNDNESKVIRAAMRTLAKICYKFGNVTTETKEAKFRQALDDLLEIALDYPFENEQLLGELLVEEPIFIKPTLVATSDAKVDTLFIFRIPNKFIGPLTDAGLDELRKSEPSTPVFDLFPKLKRLLISGEWTSTYLQHISLAILPGESNNASLTHKVGQLTMYLTTLQHQRRALGFPDRPMYGHSLGSDGLHILVSYWEEGNIVIPTESVASFPIAASDLRARAIAIFQSFQFLRRLVATMSEFFEQDLQRWDAQVGARSLSDPRNQWRDLIPPLPRFSSSSSSPRPPPSNMGPPGPPRSGPPSSSGSGSRAPSRREPIPGFRLSHMSPSGNGNQAGEKRLWSERNSGGLSDRKRQKISEELGECESLELSKENVEILEKVTGDHQISIELWRKL